MPDHSEHTWVADSRVCDQGGANKKQDVKDKLTSITRFVGEYSRRAVIFETLNLFASERLCGPISNGERSFGLCRSKRQAVFPVALSTD